MIKYGKRVLGLLLAAILAAQPLPAFAQLQSEDTKKSGTEQNIDDPKDTAETEKESNGDGKTEGEDDPADSRNQAEPLEDESKQESKKPDGQGNFEEAGEVVEPITKEDKPYLALGANLSENQRDTVLQLLGIDPDELADYDVIYITNEEEYQYLGSYVSSDKIGSRSLSSVLVVKRDKGHGINITTKNISYCTIGMYKNALITAGITDADIIVAGPVPISGTAALVGAMKAYSVMTGEDVSEESMDAALNELVLTGDLADTLGDSQKVEEFVAYLKQQIIEQGLDTEEEIQTAIEDASQEFNITLSEDEIQQITRLLQKISSLDLDLDTVMNQAKDLYDKLADIGDAEGFFDKIMSFFNSILDFFKGLF